MSVKVWFSHVTELINALGVILMERHIKIATVSIADSIDMLDVLLTVHLSIILVVNQLNAQNLVL